MPDPHAQLAQLMARVLAAAVKDPTQTPYVAALARSIEGPIVYSVTRPCTNCHRDCLIDATMLQVAEGSAGIVCSECIQEITGKSMTEIITHQMKLLNKNRPDAEA